MRRTHPICCFALVFTLVSGSPMPTLATQLETETEPKLTVMTTIDSKPRFQMNSNLITLTLPPAPRPVSQTVTQPIPTNMQTHIDNQIWYQTASEQYLTDQIQRTRAVQAAFADQTLDLTLTVAFHEEIFPNKLCAPNQPTTCFNPFATGFIGQHNVLSWHAKHFVASSPAMIAPLPDFKSLVFDSMTSATPLPNLATWLSDHEPILIDLIMAHRTPQIFTPSHPLLHAIDSIDIKMNNLADTDSANVVYYTYRLEIGTYINDGLITNLLIQPSSLIHYDSLIILPREDYERHEFSRAVVTTHANDNQRRQYFNQYVHVTPAPEANILTTDLANQREQNSHDFSAFDSGSYIDASSFDMGSSLDAYSDDASAPMEAALADNHSNSNSSSSSAYSTEYPLRPATLDDPIDMLLYPLDAFKRVCGLVDAAFVHWQTQDPIRTLFATAPTSTTERPCSVLMMKVPMAPLLIDTPKFKFFHMTYPAHPVDTHVQETTIVFDLNQHGFVTQGLKQSSVQGKNLIIHHLRGGAFNNSYMITYEAWDWHADKVRYRLVFDASTQQYLVYSIDNTSIAWNSSQQSQGCQFNDIPVVTGFETGLKLTWEQSLSNPITASCETMQTRINQALREINSATRNRSYVLLGSTDDTSGIQYHHQWHLLALTKLD